MLQVWQQHYLLDVEAKLDTDTFRFASELDIQGMDSTVVDDGMSYNAIHAITDGLTAVNDKGKTVPALAKSWGCKC